MSELSTSETNEGGALPWILRRRKILLVAGLLLSALSAVVGHRLTLDRSIEHMFADDDPILKPYRQLQQTFGQLEIVMAVYSDPDLTTPQGLDRAQQLAQQMREVPGVVAAVSIADPPATADFENTEIGARMREVFAGYTHNRQLDAAGIVCLLSRPGPDESSRAATLRQLRLLVSPLPDGTLVGEPVMIEEAFDLLEADGRRLNTWCTALLMLAILACFRRLRWLMLPLVVVQMTLALTRAVLVVFGLQLSMVSSMLSAIVTVVGVATIVHVIVRFQDAQTEGLSPTDALLRAGRLLAVPISFACLTDAAGFAALMISKVGPVHDFGLMMAIGSTLVLVSTALAVPGIVLLGKVAPPATHDRALKRALDHLLHWSLSRTKPILLLGTVLSIVAAFGSTRLELETDFTRNFRSDSRLVQGYDFVENHFGGAGVWDILIPAPNKLNKKYVTKVLRLETRLQEEVPRLSKAISLATVLDAGSGGVRRMKFGADLAVRSGLSVMRGRMPEFVDTIYNVNPDDKHRWLRILLRSPERLEAAEKTKLIHQVQDIATDEFPAAQVTGYYVLLTQLIESLLRDQWTTFGVATVAILVMMTVAFRSFRLALAALLPNALPVLMVFGTMGWLGVRINMGAAMIAAVSLGLSVDGSIHYILSYQRERRQGASVRAALEAVQSTVGRAAVFATLALVIGFTTLCYSDFVPTIYFGGLVSLSMIGGLVGNLVVLPMLIRILAIDHNTESATDSPH